nr:anaerobic C4-dicarboxylate transporter family protein [uncultured Flavobacterium sp.]
MANKLGSPLSEDPVFQKRLTEGLVQLKNEKVHKDSKEAKRSVIIFLIAIIIIVTYATLISKKIGLIESPTIARNQVIMAIMLLAAMVISLISKVKLNDIPNMSTFKSGMSACICVLGVAWLGDAFVSNHINEIKEAAGGLLNQYSWLLAVVLFLASMLLYSQAATTTALMPAALALGVSPVVLPT